MTTTLNREGILKLEVALARLFRWKFVAPDNVAIEILVRGLAAAGTPAVAVADRRRLRLRRHGRPAPARLLRARLLRRARLCGVRAAAAAHSQRTSSKLFLLELVCLSAAAIRQLSRKPARPSKV